MSSGEGVIEIKDPGFYRVSAEQLGIIMVHLLLASADGGSGNGWARRGVQGGQVDHLS